MLELLSRPLLSILRWLQRSAARLARLVAVTLALGFVLLVLDAILLKGVDRNPDAGD
jgi:hypothetical protein